MLPEQITEPAITLEIASCIKNKKHVEKKILNILEKNQEQHERIADMIEEVHAATQNFKEHSFFSSMKQVNDLNTRLNKLEKTHKTVTWLAIINSIIITIFILLLVFA